MKTRITNRERERRMLEQDYYGPMAEPMMQNESIRRVGTVWNWIYLALAIFSMIVLIVTVWVAFSPEQKPADKKVLKGLFISQCVVTVIGAASFIRAMWLQSEGSSGDMQQQGTASTMRLNAFFVVLLSSTTLIAILLVSLGVKEDLNIFST